jgi:hypothetical protein
MELSRRSKCNLWCMTWSGTRYIVHLTMTLDNGSVCQIPSLVSVRPFAPHAHLGNISHSGSGPFSHLLASARTLTPYKPPLPVLQLLFSPHNSSSQFTSSRAVRRSFQSRSLLDNLELLASLLRGVALCACRSSLPYWGCSHFTGTPPVPVFDIAESYIRSQTDGSAKAIGFHGEGRCSSSNPCVLGSCCNSDGTYTLRVFSTIC